ncbi:MAG TPA: FmdB family zinc ribbon protein [Solirubrobacteraceae bacterium]|nr:FmdB family zinc ribbon protein [Solirubrobacteraceae bacterium]
MPIYEYRREDGTTFELIQAMADDALTTDPETGQAVVRVLHAPAVHFKGSGFYNTDYGTKRRAREREAEKASSNGAAKESKSDGASSKDAAPKKDAKDAKKKAPSSSSSSS